MVRGLAEAAAQRLVAARTCVRLTPSRTWRAGRGSPGATFTCSQRRVPCNPSPGIVGMPAHWSVAGVQRMTPLLQDAPVHECFPEFAAPSEGNDLIADYASLGLTLGRHPLALLRRRLARMQLATAEELRACSHGLLVRAAGIVIGRQRPDTASGVVFVTLEDETGSVNVIVWRDLADRQRRELLGSRLLGVHGVLEREGDVIHLVAKRLVDHSELLGALQTFSRDFH